jgi:DNA-binding beta-propeller fold protein YncE
VNVIKDKVNGKRAMQSGVALLCLAAICLVFADGPAAASSKVPLKSIAQITADDDGRPISYPYALFFDPVEEEIYLVNGGSSRVVVYGPDFFPRVSMGVGRGVVTPRGATVMKNGEVYISQPRNVRNPSPRITIMNGAFFIEREIVLGEIPEAIDFSPVQVAVNQEGNIYLVGSSSRGVLVLDKEGNFLRRLQPRDNMLNPWAAEPEKQEQQLPEEQEDQEEEALFAGIPEEFRPVKKGDKRERSRVGEGPVRINFVTIDSAGNIYLLSPETSRIYVYGPDESFLFAFGQKGGSPRMLSQPKALAIDERRGRIYVADYMRHTILTYDMKGEFLFEFGGRGFGPGWFNYPIAIQVNNHGQVIVADLFNKRVQVLEVGYEPLSPGMKDIQPDEVPPEEPAEEKERKDVPDGESDQPSVKDEAEESSVQKTTGDVPAVERPDDAPADGEPVETKEADAVANQEELF